MLRVFLFHFESIFVPPKIIDKLLLFSEDRFPLPHTLKFDLFSTAVTLKLRTRSPKLNKVFIMSQCYIHVKVTINPIAHVISCTQESPTPKLIGSLPKIKCISPHPPPFGWGHNFHEIKSIFFLRENSFRI